jgi:chitinase
MGWPMVTRLRFATLAALLAFLAFHFIFSSSELSPTAHPPHERRSGDLQPPDQTLALPSNWSLHRRAEDYSCSKDNPCPNSACCGSEGYCGYGPTYCGDGCQANCDANAECGEFAKTPGLRCPLNVCCSEFGFCGTTQDFCEGKCQSNCGQPSVPSGANSRSARDKVIAYYEAW